MNLVFGSEIALLGFWEYVFRIPFRVQSVFFEIGSCFIWFIWGNRFWKPYFYWWTAFHTFRRFLLCFLKETGSRDRIQIFWHKWIFPGIRKEDQSIMSLCWVGVIFHTVWEIRNDIHIGEISATFNWGLPCFLLAHRQNSWFLLVNSPEGLVPIEPLLAYLELQYTVPVHLNLLEWRWEHHSRLS